MKYLFLFLLMPSLVWSQTIDWNNSTSPKKGKVIIPSSVSIALPTSDDYTLGFFVHDISASTYMNVGQADYIPGQKITIPISYDANGVNGYKEGERYITLIKNKANADVYGVEFFYEDGKNAFVINDSSIISGVFTNTWKDFGNPLGKFCKSQRQLVMAVPYGVNTKIMYSNGVKVDSSGLYPIIKLSEMDASYSYSVQLLPVNIKYNKTLYSILLDDFPMQVLNREYIVCPGHLATVPQNELDNTIHREALGTHSFSLYPGKYIYTTTYSNGCSTSDTVTVKIDPQFPLNEINKTIEICNGDTAQIQEYNSDGTIWRGTIKSGGRIMTKEGTYTYPLMHFSTSCSVVDTVTLKFKPFPTGELNKTYSLCPGNFIEVPQLSYEGKLERKRLDNGPHKLIVNGEYIFNAKYLATGCEMADTIEVVSGINCEDVRYPQVFNPIYDTGLVFSNEEEIIIYNMALVKVAQFKGPVIWGGNDNSGAVLPVGIYYIVDGKGNTKSVSLIY